LFNIAIKKTTLFQKDGNQLSAVRTISNLMVLSFDEVKLIYNQYWGKLSKAEKKIVRFQTGWVDQEWTFDLKKTSLQ